jgi:hypothetical protein
MAKVGRNVVTTKLSGKLGDLIVFRTRGNRTYVASAPQKKDREPTQNQKEHQQHFQEAIVYGKGVIADPNLKATYQEAAGENQSAFNVAVADFMSAPQIEEIDLSNYHGNPGDTIRVRAVDDFMVVQVAVSIFNGDSSLVEEGTAVKQPNEIDWVYTTKEQNSNLTGDKIVIRVSDMPGNITSQEKML